MGVLEDWAEKNEPEPENRCAICRLGESAVADCETWAAKKAKNRRWTYVHVARYLAETYKAEIKDYQVRDHYRHTGTRWRR